MGIFDRLSRLIRANVHSQLDKAEDPEKMLDLLIRDAEAGRVEGHEQLVLVMAERNRIAAESENEEKSAQKALRQAEAAARKGDDDLAREALRRRNDAIEAADLFAQQAESQQVMVDRLKSQLSVLDTKLRRMRHERDRLVAQHRIASTQTSIADTAKLISGAEVEAEFGRIQGKVRQADAVAKASIEAHLDSYDGRLDALEDEQVESQLLSIKERLVEDGALPESNLKSISSKGGSGSKTDRAG